MNDLLNMIDDIALRIGDPILEKGNYPPFVLRTMNRVYREINRETRYLVKSCEMDFSTLSPLVQYWALAADFMGVARLEPHYDWMEPNDFVFEGESESETDETFTIIGGKIYFSNIQSDTKVTMHYRSSGYALVLKEDGSLGAGEANAPEWQRKDFHDLLYYATCLEISQDYPHAAKDLASRDRLFTEMRQAGSRIQEITPLITGGWRASRRRDDGYGEY